MSNGCSTKRRGSGAAVRQSCRGMRFHLLPPAQRAGLRSCALGGGLAWTLEGEFPPSAVARAKSRGGEGGEGGRMASARWRARGRGEHGQRSMASAWARSDSLGESGRVNRRRWLTSDGATGGGQTLGQGRRLGATWALEWSVRPCGRSAVGWRLLGFCAWLAHIGFHSSAG